MDEPQPINSLLDFFKSHLGSSIVALAALLALAIPICLVRSYLRMKRRARRKKLNVTFNESTPMLNEHHHSEKHETCIPNKPELAYQSPRPYIDQIERHPTPQYSPISTYSPQHDPYVLKNTPDPHPNASSRQLYPTTLTQNSTSLLRNYTYPPQIQSQTHIHAPIPRRAHTTRVNIHPLDAGGRLLRPIPWICDDHTLNSVNPHTDVNPNNETYPGPTAPLATRTRSRSRTLVEEGSTYLASSASVKSNFITTDQIRRNPSSSSHFDGNVEDRYPMALSSSFFSLYSKNSGSHHRIGSGRSQDQDSEEEEVEKEEEEDAGSIIAVTDTDGSNSEYGQDITQVHQEGEQQRGYPTTSSYSTISSEALEPTLIAYYSFSPDEVVASTADTSTSPTSPTTTATCNVVRAIIKDDRNNYLPLSSKILTQKATSNTKLNFSTSTSNADLSSSAVTWTNYDRAKSRGTIKRPAGEDVRSLIDQFPVVPKCQSPIGIETDSSSLSQVYCCGRKGKENDGPEYRPTARQRQRQIPPVYVKHGESEQEAHIQEGAVLEPASYSVFGSKNTDIINTNLNIRKVQDRKRERERSREKDITWDRDKDRDRVGVGRGSGVDVISQLRKKGGVGKENVPVPF